jgi:prepilin-type N-terminal cleavage/methylation domain-containing protein
MTMSGGHDIKGFSLVEVLVCTSLIAVVAIGLAQLTAVAVDATRAAGRDNTALLLAVQKMEQLRSLPWRYDPSGRYRVSDRITDLTRDPPGTGGTGLTPSPTTSLDRNIAGYVDHLDRRGAWVGAGTTPPPGTSFVRRWSVGSHRLAPADLLRLDVVVLPVRLTAHTGWTTGGAIPPGVVWLSTLRGRH